MKEKMLKLYKDWNRSKSITERKKARTVLDEAISNPAAFTKLAKIMGDDGFTLLEYFNESKHEFSSNIFTAKRKAANYLKEGTELKPIDKLDVDNFRLAWEPTEERSNTVASYIEAGTPSGTAAEIVRAIVGGNMQIAAALTIAGWSKLNPGDLNAIMNIAKVHSSYNMYSGVPKDNGVTKFYNIDVTEGPVKKKGDISKNEFIAQVFPYADPQNTKLYDIDNKK